jgi:POLQ-like helicase
MTGQQMKPNSKTKYVAAVTQSQGKMFEYHVPIEHHISVPRNVDFVKLFPIAIGTLGDFAASLVRDYLNLTRAAPTTALADLRFAALVMNAYVETRENDEVTFELLALSAAAYYLAGMPGNATVQVKKLSLLKRAPDNLYAALLYILSEPWSEIAIDYEHESLNELIGQIGQHFHGTGKPSDIWKAIGRWREQEYGYGTAHNLLLCDIISAVSIERIARSSRNLLPKYSDFDGNLWEPYLGRKKAIKEIWPSQKILGEAGLYRGASAVIQMPTSAGKTKATELVIRSAFLSRRTSIAVLVAPFRALVQEIANSLRHAFLEDGYQVNQIGDALQNDFLIELEELFENKSQKTPHVIVITPEKLLYILRQLPTLVDEVGLVIYDEGHQFDTGSRGVIYELLLTSIRRLLKPDAQSVLISAVVPNGAALAEWLLNDKKSIVSDSSMQTERALAFISWPDRLMGQLRFLDKPAGEESFFVPRVIELQNLTLRGRETKPRPFPDRDDSASIALYLALKLVPNGGVAIFCGTKSSAAKIVRDAVEEVFARGVNLNPPSQVCDQSELAKLSKLYLRNFGQDSYLTKAASLGIFAHHRNTPHGLRLSVECAMRDGLIPLIICTSTLAQGVNLPIRYLLVSGTQQGNHPIKVRDFHNLMGRAGRAGMHGEGTVIFTDHTLFDERQLDSFKWEAIQKMLMAEHAEPTGSTLLELVKPITSVSGRSILSLSVEEVIESLLHRPHELVALAENPPDHLVLMGFSKQALSEQLQIKFSVLDAVQSFLMAHREEATLEDYFITVEKLSKETLAYYLATESEKSLLLKIFDMIARDIEERLPDVERQARFGRTLLGVSNALVIDQWMVENLDALAECASEENMMAVLWPLLVKLTPEPRLRDTFPLEAVSNLAIGWINGESYVELQDILDGAWYPHGRQHRRFTIDMVVDLCETTFGFEFSLLLAAVREAALKLVAAGETQERMEILLSKLQKRLKYGLSNESAIAYYEVGFAERVVAEELGSKLSIEKTGIIPAIISLLNHTEIVRPIIDDLPSYFKEVYDSLPDRVF